MKNIQKIFFFVALVFMVLAIANQWDQINSIEWKINSVLLILSIVMLLGIFLLDAFGWHLILKKLGCEISIKSSIRIWVLSSVARYVPGGVWSYTGRAIMAKDLGIGLSISSISMYLETILLAASSFAIGFPAILKSTGVIISPYQAILIWLLLGICLHPKIIKLLRFIPGRIGKAIANSNLPSSYSVLMLYIYYLFFWFLFAITFCVFCSAIIQTSIDQYFIIGSSFALAFCIGLVIIIFPSGIGIREATLYSLLATVLPPNLSLIIAIGGRLWTTLGEALTVILVLFWKKEINTEAQTTET